MKKVIYTWLAPHQTVGSFSLVYNVEFEAEIKYPKPVYKGKGFFIDMKAKVKQLTYNGMPLKNTTSELLEIQNYLENGYFKYRLIIEGLEYKPKDQIPIDIDGFAHWLVTGPSDSGTFLGRISPFQTSSIFTRSYQFTPIWTNPEAFKFEIEVKPSRVFLSFVERYLSLLIGSLFSFPFLIVIYDRFRRRRKNDKSTPPAGFIRPE